MLGYFKSKLICLYINFYRLLYQGWVVICQRFICGREVGRRVTGIGDSNLSLCSSVSFSLIDFTKAYKHYRLIP